MDHKRTGIFHAGVRSFVHLGLNEAAAATSQSLVDLRRGLSFHSFIRLPLLLVVADRTTCFIEFNFSYKIHNLSFLANHERAAEERDLQFYVNIAEKYY